MIIRVRNSLYHKEVNSHYLENWLILESANMCNATLLIYYIDLHKYTYHDMMSRAQMDIYWINVLEVPLQF